MVNDTPSKFDPHRRQRQSIRLKEYDYNRAGAYFVTIVTRQRDGLFGAAVNGETPPGGHVVLSDFGAIADECWRAIPEHFPFVELGAYVVMPNHVHGIIVIRDDESAPNGVVVQPTITRLTGTKRGSLGAIIGSYKSAVSYRINQEHNAAGIWQRNYYEHIIRDDRDLQRITDYIEANPLRWIDDDENPVRARYIVPLQTQRRQPWRVTKPIAKQKRKSNKL